MKESGLFKWISFGVSETAYLVRNAKLDDGLWDDGQGSYGGKLVHVFAPLAGVTDQTLAEIRDLYEMAGMVGQVWDNRIRPSHPIFPLSDGVRTLQSKQNR